MHLSGDVIEVKRPEEENNVEEKEHEEEVDQHEIVNSLKRKKLSWTKPC